MKYRNNLLTWLGIKENNVLMDYASTKIKWDNAFMMFYGHSEYGNHLLLELKKWPFKVDHFLCIF